MKTKVTITHIETFLLDLPTIRPHTLSMTTMKKQSIVIVRLYCLDEIIGIGEATTIGGLSYGEESPEGIKLAIDNYLAPLLIDQDATQINSLIKIMNKLIKGNRIAKSALETAILDAQAKRLKLSIAELLGGPVVSALPVLWTLASGHTEKDIAEAQKFLDLKRHNVFKLKIGAKDVQTDLNHVGKIKKVFGDKIKLTVDINQAWSEATAMRAIPALIECGVDLIEQPIAKENILGLKKISKKFNVPIMADESICTISDAFMLGHLQACDVFAIKIAKSGGPLSVIKVAHVIEAFGGALYGGTLLEGSVGTAASLQAFSTIDSLEWGTELFGPLILQDDVVVNALEYKNYHLQLPSGYGVGVELDMEKVKFYRRD